MKKSISVLLISTLSLSVFLAVFAIYDIFNSAKSVEHYALIVIAVLLLLATILIIVNFLKPKRKEKQGKKANSFSAFFTTKNITRLAIFSALSIVLYLFVKTPLPFFPPFLDLQISDMPAMLASFMMNPIAGIIVLLIKTLIKLPFGSTGGVGELADFLIGIGYILPAYFIYKHKKSIKSAILGMAVGSVCGTVVAMLSNWLFLIPLYAKIFEGGWDALVGIMKSLFPSISVSTFYLYYIFLSVLPFNLLRFFFTSLVTFFIYKPLKRFFDSLCKNS